MAVAVFGKVMPIFIPRPSKFTDVFWRITDVHFDDCALTTTRSFPGYAQQIFFAGRKILRAKSPLLTSAPHGNQNLTTPKSGIQSSPKLTDFTDVHTPGICGFQPCRDHARQIRMRMRAF